MIKTMKGMKKLCQQENRERVLSHLAGKKGTALT